MFKEIVRICPDFGDAPCISVELGSDNTYDSTARYMPLIVYIDVAKTRTYRNGLLYARLLLFARQDSNRKGHALCVIALFFYIRDAVEKNIKKKRNHSK